MYNILYSVISILIIVVCVLISIAFFTLVERKLLAAMQRRKGPNAVGLFGILQPLVDGLKLLVKELQYNEQLVKFILFIIVGIVKVIVYGPVPPVVTAEV